MKLIARCAWITLLPFLAGCISTKTLDAASIRTSENIGSVEKIEKAAITRDQQLCIFFKRASTNASEADFCLVISFGLLQTNAAYHDEYFSPDGTGIAYHQTRPYPGYKHIIYWTTGVPGGTMENNNWVPKKISLNDLKDVPIGTGLINGGANPVQFSNLTALGVDGFVLISNSTQTVYLTRTAPIEFVYVDSARPGFNIVTPDPITKNHVKYHPGYYCLLPLTVPADIATLPFQAIGLGWEWLVISGLGSTP